MSGTAPRTEDGPNAGPDGTDDQSPEVVDQFISHIAHELATPLSAITLWVNLISHQEDLAGPTKEGLEVIRQAAEEQQALIEALVDQSLISAGRLRLRRRPTDLTDLVQGAVDAIRPHMGARHLVLLSEVGRDLGLLDIDAPRLQRVVLQLLGNAMKFTARGRTVSLRAVREPGAVVIEVSDTGAGIAPEVVAGIFHRLERGRGNPRREGGGLGFGLSIAHHVIELHGGTITAESPGVGQGATFTVRLPLGPSASDAAGPGAAN